MAIRCPNAVPLGPYVLQNARLVFRGVADVIVEKGFEVHGGLWRITPECERALDAYEGFNPDHPERGMYQKEILTLADLPDGEDELMLYTMNSTGIYPPSYYYLNVIKEGYRDFGLPMKPLNVAVEHSHDERAPSHIERQRMRRMGRPVLAARPSVLKARKAEERKPSKKERKAAKKTAKRQHYVNHDPWANVPGEQHRRKVMNLTDWLRDRKSSGDRY